MFISTDHLLNRQPTLKVVGTVNKKLEKKMKEITGTATKKTLSKTKETKSWFFEKMNHPGKPLARLIKIKRERTEINTIRNGKEVTPDNTEIQNILRDDYKHSMLIKWTIWKKWTHS